MPKSRADKCARWSEFGLDSPMTRANTVKPKLMNGQLDNSYGCVEDKENLGEAEDRANDNDVVNNAYAPTTRTVLKWNETCLVNEVSENSSPSVAKYKVPEKSALKQKLKDQTSVSQYMLETEELGKGRGKSRGRGKNMKDKQ